MKIAMIGSYAHVGHVLNGLTGLKDVQVVAACPYGPEDKLPFLGKSEVTPAGLPIFDDPRRMIEQTRPDLVSVYVPMGQIASNCMLAVERGCHVIAEKPLATEQADLQALRAAIRKHKVHVLASLAMRGGAAFQTVRQIVDAGRIGRPVFALGVKSYPWGERGEVYRKRETYGGSIPWQAIHALDFVSYCANKDYARVAAMHGNVGHPDYPGTEDTGGILLEFVGGGHAVIAMDYFRPFEKGAGRAWGGDRLRVVGTEAEVEIVDEGKRVQLMTPKTVEDVPLATERSIVREFIDFLRTGKPPLLSCDESLRMTEFALLARQSADTGKFVELA